MYFCAWGLTEPFSARFPERHVVCHHAAKHHLNIYNHNTNSLCHHVLLFMEAVSPACSVSCFTGFHNASLYDTLQPSISPLVGLLRDEEDKTRANAAGALGNLVRNSAALCGELVRAGALAALLATAAAPERVPAAGEDMTWACMHTLSVK